MHVSRTKVKSFLWVLFIVFCLLFFLVWGNLALMIIMALAILGVHIVLAILETRP